MPLARLFPAIVSVSVTVLSCIQLWSLARTGRPRWRGRTIRTPLRSMWPHM
jgi:hypothetical protein